MGKWDERVFCDWTVDQILFYFEASLFSEGASREGLHAGSGLRGSKVQRAGGSLTEVCFNKLWK